MAPECYDCKGKITEKVDVWALGPGALSKSKSVAAWETTHLTHPGGLTVSNSAGVATGSAKDRARSTGAVEQGPGFICSAV